MSFPFKPKPAADSQNLSVETLARKLKMLGASPQAVQSFLNEMSAIPAPLKKERKNAVYRKYVPAKKAKTGEDRTFTKKKFIQTKLPTNHKPKDISTKAGLKACKRGVVKYKGRTPAEAGEICSGQRKKFG